MDRTHPGSAVSPARLRAAIDRALEVALAVLLAGMVLNVLWQVLTRFALRDPSSTSEELARFALIWLGLLGASYGFGRRRHLAIDLLAARAGARGRRALETLSQLCVVGFALTVLVVGGARLVDLTLALDQHSAALGAPLGAVYLALPLSGLLVILYALADLSELWQRRRDPED